MKIEERIKEGDTVTENMDVAVFWVHPARTSNSQMMSKDPLDPLRPCFMQ